jgi:hypothetical protein
MDGSGSEREREHEINLAGRFAPRLFKRRSFMAAGKIKWYDDAKGYGFITGDGQKSSCITPGL